DCNAGSEPPGAILPVASKAARPRRSTASRQTKRPVRRMLRRRHLGIAIMITRKFLALGILGMAAAGMLAQPASAHGGWGGGWGGGWHGGWGGGWRGGWGVGVGIAPLYAGPAFY